MTSDDTKALVPYSRLYDDLLVGYDQLIRPVRHDDDKLVVMMSLKLTQLIGVVRARKKQCTSGLAHGFRWCRNWVRNEEIYFSVRQFRKSSSRALTCSHANSARLP